MVKLAQGHSKKLRIAMIENDLRAMDLVRHLGISVSLATKLMTGEVAEPSAAVAQRVNAFFGKQIFSVKKAGSRKKRQSPSKPENTTV